MQRGERGRLEEEMSGSFQEVAFAHCKCLPDTLKPFLAAKAKEMQPITEVIFIGITVELVVNCNLFSFETRDISR